MTENGLQKARKTALLMLGRKSRTCRQIADYLSQKGFNETVIRQVIGELTASGYLNDHEYARRYIEKRLEGKPSGPYQVRSALCRFGVEREIIDAAVAEAYGEGQDRLHAARFIRQLRERGGVSPQKLLRKAVSRGFSIAAIHRALEEEFGANLDIM